MKIISRADLNPLIRRFYMEELIRLKSEIPLDLKTHPMAKQKFDAAIQACDLQNSDVPILTQNQAELLLTWLRAARDSEMNPQARFTSLYQNALSDLSLILGRESAEQTASYLLFFREVTARFLKLKPIVHTLMTNCAAFDVVFGSQSSQVFDHYSSHSALLGIYSGSFANAFNSDDRIALEKLALGNQGIIDAGGGSGGLALALSEHGITPKLYTLLDLPETEISLAETRALYLNAAHIPKQFIGGDFFSDKLGNATFFSDAKETYDTIFLTWILHDWKDDKCSTLLSNLSPLLKKDGRLIVVERIKESISHPFSEIYEFIMLLLADGVERTLPEYDELLQNSNFHRISHIREKTSRDFLVYSLKR